MYYRKMPVVIKAVMWTGNNLQELCDELPGFNEKCSINSNGYLEIKTLEGTMIASVSDYIICGVNGEFYPCKNDIFLKTYEMVTEEEYNK